MNITKNGIKNKKLTKPIDTKLPTFEPVFIPAIILPESARNTVSPKEMKSTSFLSKELGRSGDGRTDIILFKIKLLVIS